MKASGMVAENMQEDRGDLGEEEMGQSKLGRKDLGSC